MMGFFLKSKGNKINNSDNVTFFKCIIHNIQRYKIQSVYKTICKRYKEMPNPPGLNVDWEQRYQMGLDKTRETLCLDILKDNNASLEAACSVYLFISSETSRNIAYYCSIAFPDISIDIDNIRYTESMLCSILDFFQYKQTSIKQYMFMASLDTRTCPICGNLDGQLFNVSDGKIGTNFPPIHRGCRCTTIAVINPELLMDTNRMARDPETGKSIKVPITMNYKEWYGRYVAGKDIGREEKPKNRNLTREQYERYQERGVGPNSYEEFLKAKEDPDTWRKMKTEYRQAGIAKSGMQQGKLDKEC